MKGILLVSGGVRWWGTEGRVRAELGVPKIPLWEAMDGAMNAGFYEEDHPFFAVKTHGFLPNLMLATKDSDS